MRKMQKIIGIADLTLIVALILACPTESVGDNNSSGSGGNPITWTPVTTPTPFGTTCYISDIAYGSGRFVAVGYYASSPFNGEIAWSDDGKTWHEIETASKSITAGKQMYCVAYGGGRFVAGGQTLAWSDDGENWTEVAGVPGTKDCIAYGDGTFVVGTGSSVLYSTDKGLSWTQVPSVVPFFNSIRSIAYGDGKFVIGGYYGKMVSSPDGKIWTDVPNSTFPDTSSYYIKDIAYGADKFVAVNTNNEMRWSSDSTIWNTITSPFSSYSGNNCIAYGGGRFVAISREIAYSSDGIRWTLIPSSLSIGLRCIAYGNGMFVAGSNSGRILYSIVE